MPSSELIIVGTYDRSLVCLSIFIAMVASYAALDLAGRVTSARGWARWIWLNGGAVAMGLGIWSMHYIGMLALRLPVPVSYDWPTVLLSLLAAIHASGVALFVVSRREMKLSQALVGSVFMGTGIAGMHYIGMAAMRLPAMCQYSTGLVILSVFFAVAISFLALWLAFYFRTETTAGGWKKAASALILGGAIPVMHYTGMAAASFTPHVLMTQDLAHAVSLSSLGILAVITITLLVLGFVVLTSIQDRRISVQSRELDSSEQRYRRIVETTFDAFVGMDPNGLITDWNSQAETTFGWTKSQALGQSFSRMVVLDRHCESHQEDELKLLLYLAQTDMPRKRMEVLALHRDGREIPVELMISAITLGSAQMFAVFVQDVSDRNRAMQERERAKNIAEAANRSKSEFLANMSHEIRTPLNGIVGMADLALDTNLSTEQREYIETVKMSADSLLSVINDILDFSKIEAGKIDLESIDFDLRDSLESALKTLAFQAQEKGLELLCDVALDVRDIVRGDSSRLRQVILNLVGNAIKFTDHGEVGLKVIVDSTDHTGHILQFTVSDTGIGIDPQKQKLIFDPFSQADSSTTRKYGGTGLGLTISTRLVEMMGGRIWVESELGRGTQFHFTVHFGIADSNQVEAGTPASRGVLRGAKVLVVDDNKTNRRILEGLLKRWNMRSYSAEGGEEGLRQLSAAREAGDIFKLVLVDMNMPVMNGFTLVERIRETTDSSETTIIMLTSAGRRGDASICQALGIAAYLLKPVRPLELREAITLAIGARGQKEASPLITRYSLQGAPAPPTSLRILLAEDNTVNQRLASRLLEKRGHTVLVASNGVEAVRALEKEKIDLVLMDMQMPEMDGLEATAAIRQMENQRGTRVPIIALTAHAMKGDKERCLDAGMDGYLSKPIRPEELDAMLDKYAAPRTGNIHVREIVDQSR